MASCSCRFGSILCGGAIFWQRAQCHVACGQYCMAAVRTQQLTWRKYDIKGRIYTKFGDHAAAECNSQPVFVSAEGGEAGRPLSQPPFWEASVFPRRGARAACVALLPGDCVTRSSCASTLTNKSATFEPERGGLADNMLYVSLLPSTALLRKCNKATFVSHRVEGVCVEVHVRVAGFSVDAKDFREQLSTLVALEAEGALNLCYVFLKVRSSSMAFYVTSRRLQHSSYSSSGWEKGGVVAGGASIFKYERVRHTGPLLS